MRTFRALLPMLEECANRYLLPLLCREQYDALVAEVKANTVTTANLPLLAQVRRALAKWTVFHSAQSMPMLVEREGFRVISNADAIDQRAYSTEAIRGAIEGQKEQAQHAARNAMGEITDLLYASPDDYPLWKASPCCKSSTLASDYIVVDSGCGGVFL